MPVINGARVEPHDPLAVFRTARLPRWALVRQTLDATQIEDVAAAVEEALGGAGGLTDPIPG